MVDAVCEFGGGGAMRVVIGGAVLTLGRGIAVGGAVFTPDRGIAGDGALVAVGGEPAGRTPGGSGLTMVVA
jgi:hypothetical protein